MSRPTQKPRRRRPCEGEPKSKRGRPPSAKAELTDRIADHVRATGVALAAAAEYHRVFAATARKWFDDGRADRTPATRYFYVEMLQARAHWETRLAALVTRAAENNGELALRALARRSPEWRESSNLEMVTPLAGDDPQAEATVAALRRSPEARRLLAAYLAALEAAGYAP